MLTSTSQGQIKEQSNEKQQKQQKERTLTIRKWIVQNRQLTAAIVCGLLLAGGWLASSWLEVLSIILYLVAFVVGGFVQAKEGVKTLIHDKDIDVNLLMILAAIGAASIGYWAEGAVLIFIFSLSGALETYTMQRSSRDISALMDMKPETATLVTGGKETVVRIEELQVGNIVVVKPGERIPADGEINKGTSSVNQASITGESVPVDKSTGDEVYAGTINGHGALFIEVTKTSESSLFAKIIRLVQEAQDEKPVSQLFIERFERIYAKAIIIITVLLLFALHYLLGWTWTDTFYKAMVFLVVASPCALVAAIMPATLSAISNSARKGLLFKGGAYIELLAKTKVIAFDKTGTLTTGRPTVTDLYAFQGYSKQSMLEIAACVESLSEHPLAKAIVNKAQEEGLTIDHPAELQALVGWGVQAKYRDETWTIGKSTLADDLLGNEEIFEQVSRLQEQGKTVVIVRNSWGIAGVIALQDRLREQAKITVAKLRSLGIEVAMLTGDGEKTAKSIAEEAGIKLVYSELLPEDKLRIISELRGKYGNVVMVGDGVNDAPALASATIGIAMGGAGSDAALETADLVLMNDDIERIVSAIHLGKRTNRIVKQNIAFALLVIIGLILTNFVQGIPLPLGVVGHEGSTILVILNGLRLLR